MEYILNSFILMKEIKHQPIRKRQTYKYKKEQIPLHPQTGHLQAMIRSELQYLRRILLNWAILTNNYADYGSSSTILLRNYLQKYRTYYEEDRFNWQFELLPSLEVNISRIASQDIIFKSFNLFHDPLWPIRLSNRFLARLSNLSYEYIICILGHILHLARGNFNSCTSITHKNIPFNRAFLYKITKNKNLLVCVGVEKVPVLKNRVIKRYEFNSYMGVVQLMTDFESQYIRVKERLSMHVKQMEEDVVTRDHSEELLIMEEGKERYLFEVSMNEYTERMMVSEVVLAAGKYSPMRFKAKYLSAVENQSILYDKRSCRWLDRNLKEQQERREANEAQRKANQEMLKTFVDFKSASKLVELLCQIPNFKIRLTTQEQGVIGVNGNVLVIGRSGTGKTTCGILRLFAIEMLFKIRLSLFQKKYGGGLKVCGAEDIDKTLGLRCVFLTASPVLTHEVQRYYKKLTNNIKLQLQKKKERLILQQKQRRNKQQQQQRSKQQQQRNRQQQQRNKQQKVNKQSQTIQLLEGSQVRNEQSFSKIQEIDFKVDRQEQQYKEMKEQLHGIQLQEQQQQQQQQDMDVLKNKFEQNMHRFQSLQDLSAQDYPGFFTVRSFIMMIDGCLSKPFFIRTQNQPEEHSKAAWHNQKKGVMMIENYYRREQASVEIIVEQQQMDYSDQSQLQHEYMRQMQLREQQGKQQLTKKLQKKKNLSFEVDYEYFLAHFWPTVRSKYYSTRMITPQLVWTEIYSTIKGSAATHMYPGQFLPMRQYIEVSTNSFLTQEEKKDIYEAFCQYERWKTRVGGYDIMDAVNYILNKMQYSAFQGPQLHYVMIDEVQDLPHAIVYLLSKVASYGVFYSGDTAQTIAKGVGFRFCDLKNLFNSKLFDSSLKLASPVVKHLTVNFRSHNNILQLANSVVSAIEILFPKTIDRMNKEISDLVGNKPIIVEEGNIQMLFYVLCGDNGRGQQRNKLQFGCDQVIIVRDQESKGRVPSILQHALCLTIYEAKGLQFNDVILFNFFTDSKIRDNWSLLRMLEVSEVDIDKEEYQRAITRHREEEGVDNVDFEVEEQGRMCRVKRISLKNSAVRKDVNDYAELCSELKQLYTAITRPRKNLIIYDDDASLRKEVERIWYGLNVTQCAMQKQSEVVSNVLKGTSAQEWRRQGLKMYSWGYFQQAIKCFQRGNDPVLLLKSVANRMANTATGQLLQVGRMKGTSQTKGQKAQCKRMQQECYRVFKEAGDKFAELKMMKQAGQCYFSGREYLQARDSFERVQMWKQAAESMEMLGKYEEAAEVYLRAGDYLKAIECLDMLNLWMRVLEVIQKYAGSMGQGERNALTKKFAALALSNLVYEIEFEHEIANEDQNNVIVEKESQEEEDCQEEQEGDNKKEQNNGQQQKQVVKQQNKEIVRQQNKEIVKQQNKQTIKEQQQKQPCLLIQNATQSKQKQIKKLNQSQMSQYEILQTKEIRKQKLQQLSSFQDIEDDSIIQQKNQIPKQQQKCQIIKLQQQTQEIKTQQKNIDNNSYSSFADIQSCHQPDQQSIRSLIDPQDLWVRNSLSQIPLRLQSQYSALQGAPMATGRIIKTRGNIMIQDQIMSKIVRIVSLVSDQPQFLKQFKGYQSLLTQTESVRSQPLQMDQFQDFDPVLIDTILDTLESFKLFKLCLFVCNRYNLAHKAGRYLTSAAVKYSPNCTMDQTLNPGVLSASHFRKSLLEKGILANFAVHAILENVNADFLKVNSLGMYFAQALILQGMYKKTIFLLESKDALQVLSTYSQYSMHRELYREKGKDVFLQHPPATQEEIKYTVTVMKEYWVGQIRVRKPITISPRYIVQLNSSNKELQMVVPKYLPYAAKVKPIQQLLLDSCQVLRNGLPHEVVDLVGYLLLLLYDKSIPLLSPTVFLHLYKTLNYIRVQLKKLSCKNARYIVQGMACVYKCSMVADCEPMCFLSSYSLVHRGSILVNEFVGKDTFCYFFEQDYDWLIVKTTDVINLMQKRWQVGLIKLCQIRYNQQYVLDKNEYDTYETVKVRNEEAILKMALENIVGVNIKKKKKVKETYPRHSNPKNPLTVYVDKISLHSSEQQFSQEENNYRQIFLLPTFNSIFNTLSDIFVDLFNKRPKQPTKSSQLLLYCNHNDLYREYTERNKIQTYLYDAIEYKKYRRFDLYAQSILPIISDFGTSFQHYYIEQLLTLALVQHIQQQKNQSKEAFILHTPKPLVYHFEGLKQMNPLEYCYINPYVSERPSLEDTIIYLLQLLEQYGLSSTADFKSVTSMYILNVPNTSYKIINLLLHFVNNLPYRTEVSAFMAGCKGVEQFVFKRKIALDKFQGSNVKIIVYYQERNEKNIQESELDYQEQGRRIEVRRNAVRKIEVWWKKLERKVGNNYFENRIYRQVAKDKKYTYSINEYRLTKCMNGNVDVLLAPSFLLNTTQSQEQLLSFFLRHHVNSSLDFHFILITLNQIQEKRRAYFKACRWSEEGILNQEEMHALIQFAESTCNNIQLWRKDQKWLKEENVVLKKKKLFQLKWMSKNINKGQFEKLLKKRAGVKKQAKLQQKRMLLKRLANQ